MKTLRFLEVNQADAVRQAARSVLERNGYRVLEAQNGGEALLIAEMMSSCPA